MGRRRLPAGLGATAQAVLVPLGVLLVLACSAGVAAAHERAAVLHGPWAWLGDSAGVLGVCGALALLGVPAALRRERARRSGLGGVDAMSGEEFEGRLAELFASLGYEVRRTGARGDFGADLVLESRDERTVVQAKCYEGAVGIDAVQQVIGATRYYDASQAMVVTSSTFTPAAAALAAAHAVELVERETLAGLLAAHPLPAGRSRAFVVLAGEVAGGVAIVLFALGGMLRLSGRVLSVTLRAPAAPRRARR